MTHLTRLVPILAALCILPTGLVSAEDTPRLEDGASGRHHYDYSRFSDGPRRVPRARGRALERAETLGLGTRRAATRLLTRAPDPRWVEAVRGPAPERLQWPVEGGRFGRGFGFVRRTRPDLRHDGVDIGAPEGAEVHAVADGIVAYSDNGIRGFGNCVLIVHANGWVSLYAHHYRNTVQAGWRVHRGERIGFVGSTGIARGPHLHFELHQNGRAIDPSRFFEGRPTAHDPRAQPAPQAFAPVDMAAPRGA